MKRFKVLIYKGKTKGPKSDKSGTAKSDGPKILWFDKLNDWTLNKKVRQSGKYYEIYEGKTLVEMKIEE